MRNEIYLEELEELAREASLKGNNHLEYIAFRLRETLKSYETDLESALSSKFNLRRDLEKTLTDKYRREQ